MECSFTNSIPNMQEIHSIVKSMRSNAALRPDGLNAAFYKSSWEWIGIDVLNLISSFYQTSSMPPEINCTHIALIPKVSAPLRLKIIGRLVSVMWLIKLLLKFLWIELKTIYLT